MPLPVIYIKLYRNKISMLHLKTGKQVEGEPPEIFSSDILLIAEMTPAVELGRSLVRQINRNKWLPFLRPAFKAVVHPCEFAEKSFSSIEKVSFFHFAEQLGAADVTICASRRELTMEEARQQFGA